MNILQQCYYPVITAIKNPHQLKTREVREDEDKFNQQWKFGIDVHLSLHEACIGHATNTCFQLEHIVRKSIPGI